MKKIIRYIIEAIVVFGLTFILTVTNLFSGLDYMLKDFMYQRPRGVDNDIKIIAIDERTLEELGPINTWSRQYYADLINYFNQDANAKPSVIAFDILFSGYFGENGKPTEGDIAFADAVRESGNVVLVSQFQYEEKPTYYKDGTIGHEIKAVYYPYKE
ncbi:MAG: CHASE2 domain-containing protein, partial [Lachnospiraceae bacterium]|nr:CHASE2 domain-containing protein [Lachnospiraceae bacterium]